MRWWLKAVSGTLGAAALLWAGPAFSAGKTGSAARWAAADLDEEGDVRVVVTYREGRTAERPAFRVANRQRARVRHAFSELPGDVLKVRPEHLAEVLAEFESDADVAEAEPDRRSQHILQSVPWGISMIAADPGTRAALGTGDGAGVKVAVIDTGIWRSPTTGKIHPDLAAVYKGGYDFVNDDSGPWDDHGHGTHIAGIVAAVNNRVGVVGVAPGVSLYALKTLDKFGGGWDSDFVAAIDWSIKHGIRVVNYSAGGATASSALERACARARAAGIVVVAAAGNDEGPVLFPAAYNTVIAVGAVDQFAHRVITANWGWGSNSGPELDLVAPGNEILSDFRNPPSDYVTRSGSSMAAPHVTGAAALLAGRGVSHPDVVQDFLEDTARDLGDAGRDPFYGAGLVDAGAVLAAAPPTIDAPLAGEVVPSGASFYPLRWEPVAGAASYRLLFSSGGGNARYAQIASGVGDTSFAWNAPVVGKSLTSARFQVAAYDAAGRLVGLNTQRFAVQAVAINAPLWGDDVVGGSTVDFSWSSYATVRRVHRVAVDVSKNRGASWKRVKTLAATATSWQWRSPVVTAPRADLRFRVVLLDRAGKSIGSSTVSLDLIP